MNSDNYKHPHVTLAHTLTNIYHEYKVQYSIGLRFSWKLLFMCSSHMAIWQAYKNCKQNLWMVWQMFVSYRFQMAIRWDVQMAMNDESAA